MSVAYTWGTEDAERRLPFPCDRYAMQPEAAERCRLLVKIVARYPSGLTGVLMRWALPWGDLVMMRRQLLDLKALAEERL